ncbi:MAG: TIGR03667 family PPOX class F420-dependent oxidoreductase [Acidimicrobiales bacterium]
MTERIRRRIDHERIVWLTTVSPSGRPAPRPVWFVWDGEAFVVYSKPDTAKLRHIDSNERVTLHFNSDAYGRDVVVIVGRAHRIAEPLPPSACPGYLDKYADRLGKIGHDPASYDEAFRVALRITPERSYFPS